MFIKSLSLAVASAALLIGAGAQAAILGFTTPATFTAAATGSAAPLNQIADQVNWGAFDDSIGQPRNMGTINNGKQMTTALGETVTVTNSSSNQKAFTTYVEGGGTWNGNFVNGTTVLYNTNSVTTTLSFTNALSGLGVDLQTKLSASAYTFSISAFDAAGNLLGTVSNANGVSNGINAGTTHEGSVAFLGLTSDAANISYVTISSNNNSLGFAIDTSLIYHTNTTSTNNDPGGQQTPEPGTLALLGAGLAALGAVRRRRRRA